MLGSFYCLDNDIILKLATCNLFDDTIKTFALDSSQVKILESFKYKFSKEIKRKRGNQVNKYNVEKALHITQNYSTIAENDFENIEQNFYNKLLNYSKKSPDQNNTIDQGEAILISYVSYLNAQNNTSYLLTGDKRCLRALINSGFTDIIAPLQGKIWCLEQLILKNIDKFGFDYVKNNIIPVNDCDVVLKVAFASELTTFENSINALKSYIKDLRQETGKLLNYYPD